MDELADELVGEVVEVVAVVEVADVVKSVSILIDTCNITIVVLVVKLMNSEMLLRCYNFSCF